MGSDSTKTIVEDSTVTHSNYLIWSRPRVLNGPALAYETLFRTVLTPTNPLPHHHLAQ